MDTQRATRVVVIVASLLLVPIAAWAQSSITGVVRDTSGAVLPGVTVEAASPVLIEKVRSVVTDESGVYRIVDLRPGTYTVTFTLPGFNTFRRDGVVLPSEFTATVNADLTVGQLEETITVTGEAPVVDIRSSRAQVQLAQETLQSLPGAGRLNMVSMVLPGATLRRESDRGVGGLSDRTQTAYSVHGAPEAQPIMDGMNHQIASLTSGTFVYNQINLQEVVVETSGVGADRDTGGMQLEHDQQGRRQHLLGRGHVRVCRPEPRDEQHYRRTARSRARPAAGRVGQEIQGLGIRHRRSDQAGSACGSSPRPERA